MPVRVRDMGDADKPINFTCDNCTAKLVATLADGGKIYSGYMFKCPLCQKCTTVSNWRIDQELKKADRKGLVD